jgi:cellulose synthase/poly-beta-1,6-N-acetylglucosamine synthase-like glycosyltransferase
VPPDAYQVLLYANNCRDSTVERARMAGDNMALRVQVLEVESSELCSAAGLARRMAMDLAADQLEAEGHNSGVILTTDADSLVAATWLANTWREFALGADCVAGYIDADPREFVSLGRDFQHRGLLEEHYHAVVAEIFALLDPRPHDPWPNHQVSSGASLGITLKMYRAIGGLPSRAAGEDAALTLAVECANGKVRHAMDVCVSTSCRLDGRAAGGAADAMKLRHAVIDTSCDEELEPAFTITQKAWLKGHLRRASDIGFMHKSPTLAGLDLSAEQLASLVGTLRQICFEAFWQQLCSASTALRYRNPLRPSMLPAEIARAEALLLFLRAQPDPLEAIDFFMEDSVTFEARLHSL